MKKENVTITFESEQLAALEYLASRTAPAARPRRPARPAKPQPRVEPPSVLASPDASEKAGG